jgi:large subunit ribosomal protein L35
MAVKLKSHSGAKKRMKRTASGKYKVKKSGGRHLLARKGGRRLRRIKGPSYIHETMDHRMVRLLPYG